MSLGSSPPLGIGQRVLLGLITLYRYTLAFFLGGRCRFEPTCSVYGARAIATHGALRGSWMAVKRIGRCHPWGGQGLDPVPPRGDVAAAGDGR